MAKKMATFIVMEPDSLEEDLFEKFKEWANLSKEEADNLKEIYEKATLTYLNIVLALYVSHD